jgi:isopenicillin N synthase-like dioxygenase
MSALSSQLIQAFSLGLNLQPDYLDQYFTDPNIILRLLHYPAISCRPSEDVFGSAPHTDYGCLTLLAQDDTGGLQVKTDEDEWLDVPCLPNSIVLNTGQMMSIWSNGKLKSTPHRVINNTQKERFSVPFFYNCNMDTYVEPLPDMVSNECPLCVEAVTYGEHLEKTVRSNYAF